MRFVTMWPIAQVPEEWTLTCSDQVPEVQVLSLQLLVLSLRVPACVHLT